jgi:cell division protein FtsZ
MRCVMLNLAPDVALNNTNKLNSASHDIFASVHMPVLKVVGLGGGGGNAVDRMMELGLRGVEFITANTDHQALERSQAPVKIQLGPHKTRGLGAGGRPEIGQIAAEESWKELAAAMAGADMIFLTAGMGGGTGTGAIPVAAKIAKKIGAVTIAVVTTPFNFEMGQRQQNAQEGLAKLHEYVDTLITIPNDRLLFVAPQHLPLDTAFRLADDVLRQAVQSITELITEPGVINVDFAHIRRLMALGGGALMAIGHGNGEDRAMKAVKQALNHPLLGEVSLTNAAGVIANFTSSTDLEIGDICSTLNYLQEQTNNQAEVVMGTTVKEQMEGRVQVNLVITGLGAQTLEEVLPGAESIKKKESLSAPKKNNVPINTESDIAQPEPVLRSLSRPLHLIATNDLDVPTFLRRKLQTAG